jgi:hypothetical protein
MLNPERVWKYRLLYLDLNDLLRKKRALQTHFQRLIDNKTGPIKNHVGQPGWLPFPSSCRSWFHVALEPAPTPTRVFT